MGVGYDFEIINNKEEQNFIEVKGLDGYTGGVVFTDKEWRIACEKGENYYLVVISGISNNPKFNYYINPAKTFVPKRTISTSVSVSWNIAQKQIFSSRE